MEVSVDTLLQMIGERELEKRVLRDQIKALRDEAERREKQIQALEQVTRQDYGDLS